MVFWTALLRRFVEHCHDGFGGSHGPLKPAVHVGESAHGTSNEARVDDKTKELARGHFSRCDEACALPNHGYERTKKS